jgi:hypothetical protein
MEQPLEIVLGIKNFGLAWCSSVWHLSLVREKWSLATVCEAKN